MLSPYPDKRKTPELCKQAIELDAYAICFIPDEQKTPEMCELAVARAKKPLFSMRSIPDEYKTHELCTLAVKQAWEAIAFVPIECRTAELCRLATEQGGNGALPFIPKEPLKEAIEQLTLAGKMRAKEGFTRPTER